PPRIRPAERIARLPELEGVRLICDILEHADSLAALDLPERLAAELEVQALVIDRPRAVADDHHAVVGAGDQIVDRLLARAGRERDVRHALEWKARVAVAVARGARCLLVDPAGLLARRLIADEHPALDEVPFLGRDAVVVVAAGRQAAGGGLVG